MRSRRTLLAALTVTIAGCHPAAPQRREAPRPALPIVARSLAGEEVVVGGPGPARLVEIWASWCAPCGPAGERARAVLARHPRVVAYSLSVDEDRAALERRLAEAPPAGTPLLYPGGPAAAARGGIPDLPTFLGLDAHGRLVGMVSGLSPGLGPALERLLRRAEGYVSEPE